MKMKKLAAFALLLPLATINLTAFAGDNESSDEKKEGQLMIDLEFTLAQNDNQTEEQDDAEKPEAPEFTLSENETSEEDAEKPAEEQRG